MQKIAALNQANQALEIEIVRYFKKDEKKYLIFTLQEKDEQGYIKVYVSKVLGLNGTLAAYDIIDETEYASVKELIKRIIKANREGGPLEIEDLATDRLVNIKINGQQVFKLIGNLIELLGSNINAIADVEDQVLDAIPKEAVEVTNNVVSSNPEPTIVPGTNIQPVEEVIPVVPTAPAQNNEYLKMYQELFDRYQLLIEENTKLKTQLSSIKAIVNE